MAWDWSDELITDICDHIASGKAVSEVGKMQGYPSESAIYKQMAYNEVFSSRIARAREAQQDREMDECIRMVDEATPEDWQVIKLRVWARQWRAAKLAPKRYGDRLDLSSSDGSMSPKLDGEAAAQRQAELIQQAMMRMSDEDRARLLQKGKP